MIERAPDAVVDLGTNTFHGLVAHWDGEQLVERARERHYVRLASDGIERIGDAPATRAVLAAEAIGRLLLGEAPRRVRVFGTEALRLASNGPELRARLREALGHPIEVITGQREAQLIALGIEAAGLPARPRDLIVDIGGGSTEFIVREGGRVVFAESYRLGAQILRHRWHVDEPFGKTQEAALFGHLGEVLAPLAERLTGRPYRLVGASGTFDVLAEVCGTPEGIAAHRLDVAAVRALYAEAREMDPAQRLADPRIPDERADMLAVALALIDYLLTRLPPEELYACRYALKEGALLELARGGG